MLTEETKTFTITLPVSLYNKVSDLAEENCRSKSSQILYMIKVGLAKLNESNESLQKPLR
jgi:hypothetical protein